MAKTKKEQAEENPFEGFDEMVNDVLPFTPGRERELFEEEEEVIEEDDIQEEPIEEESDDDEKSIVPDEDDDDNTTETDDESDLVEPFFELLSDEFGFEIEDSDKPKSVKELVSFIQEVISENSKPEYANEMSAEFDAYLKAGGDPAKYLETRFREVDYTKFSIDTTDKQKRVIRDYYRTKGLPEAKIGKMIDKMESFDELEDEAAEALQELKTLQKEEQGELIAKQQEQKARIEEEHKQFINSVAQKISAVEEIDGIKLTEKDKKELLPYIFKRNNEGKTMQQIEYEKDPIEYVVATAFYLKNRDKIKKSFSATKETSAAERFREKAKLLASKKRLKSDDSYLGVNGDIDDFLNDINKTIGKKR